MDKQPDFISRLVTTTNNALVTSINDIRDKELGGAKLNHEEKAALANFDRYRITVLNAQKNDDDFHHKYRQLQVIANLSDWREFLREDFFQ